MNNLKRLLIPALAGALTLSSGPAVAAPTDEKFGRATLTQFAALPAETFLPDSEPSGSKLGTTPINGITPPFEDQPIQGFSGVIRNKDNTFHVLTDNGYGTKANSADFLLRINRIKPDFKTGKISVLDGFNLTDPDQHVPFNLVRSDRILTGQDFDPESFAHAADGTYWVGDEFGPFLLHFSKDGKLLEAPISLPDVFSPENPFRGSTPANLGGSKGLEGLALSPNRRTGYALLEGTVTGDTPGDLRLNEFDLESSSYTGKRWIYRLEDPKHSIGDMAIVDKDRFLIIERDNAQGSEAKFKKIYLADRRDHNNDGVMDKTLVADLLDIANPKKVGGFEETFRFPFFTIENLVILGNQTVGVLNDNNFPSSAGREPNKPDNNEFITIRLTQKLNISTR